jgi:hypothetical protein
VSTLAHDPAAVIKNKYRSDYEWYILSEQ